MSGCLVLPQVRRHPMTVYCFYTTPRPLIISQIYKKINASSVYLNGSMPLSRWKSNILNPYLCFNPFVARLIAPPWRG